MVFSCHQIQEHPKLLLAMTGLTRTEFLQWLPYFQYAWEQYEQNPQSVRRNNFPGEQIPQWFLLLSENQQLP